MNREARGRKIHSRGSVRLYSWETLSSQSSYQTMLQLMELVSTSPHFLPPCLSLSLVSSLPLLPGSMAKHQSKQLTVLRPSKALPLSSSLCPSSTCPAGHPSAPRCFRTCCSEKPSFRTWPRHEHLQEAFRLNRILCSLSMQHILWLIPMKTFLCFLKERITNRYLSFNCQAWGKADEKSTFFKWALTFSN